MLPQNNPDGIRIVFDDHRLVANAGLLLPATLAQHLGLGELVDHHLDLGCAPGRAASKALAGELASLVGVEHLGLSLAQRHGVKISMDGKGRYADNIFMERLWRTVKYEEVYLKAYSNGREAKAGLEAYLHFYNTQRLRWYPKTRQLAKRESSS